MIRKTFEELINEKIDIDYPHNIEKYNVLNLMKQVRIATLEEAANIADEYLNPKLGAKIQNLDKESIEIDE